MFRRSSASGFALLGLSSLLLFLPFAAVSSAERPHQTLVVVAFVFGLVLTGLVWFILRQHGLVRASYLGAAALVGSFSTAWTFGNVADFAMTAHSELAARLFVVAPVNGVGVWLFVTGLRRTFPRPARGTAAAAVALVMLGLLLGPSLLLQPGMSSQNILDVQVQLRAGYRYWTTGALILVAPFLALVTIPGEWFERRWTQATALVMAIPGRTFAVGLVLTTLALTAFLADYSFDRRATTADEIAQLWHARMLLEGRLAMPPDSNPEFFAIDNIIDRPVWMSQFPIGGPAVLALGLLTGAAWLLNPILTALTALNVYRFARISYGEPLARVAAVVLSTSPMVLIMGATHMNHTPTAWLVTLALASLPVWTVTDSPTTLRREAAFIGVAVGAAMTIRPLDGVVAAVVLGLAMLATAARDRDRARSLIVAIVAGAIPVAVLLLVNWRTTGHPLRFGYELLWGANHSLGLHDDPTGNPHTAWRALLLAVKYASQLNWIATGWPIPALLLVAVGLIFSRRANRWDVLMLSLFAVQLITYAFYWHDGQFVGPRFLFTAVPALLILVARAPFLVAQQVRGTVWRVAVVVIPVCLGVTWLRSMRPYGMQGLAQEFRESRSRLKVDSPRDVQRGALRNVLVFVQEGASARLQHRLWGLGLSRPDAARLLAIADGCTLVEATRAEESRAAADTAGRLVRMQAMIKPFRASPDNARLPDVNFRVTDTTSITEGCASEIARDYRVKNTVAYGPMLLLNRFDGSGRIAGDAIYVMDLGDRNELLRTRFPNRRWLRYEVPRRGRDTLPVLTPYDPVR